MDGPMVVMAGMLTIVLAGTGGDASSPAESESLPSFSKSSSVATTG